MNYKNVLVIICPGIHDPKLTEEFVNNLQYLNRGSSHSAFIKKILIFPAQDYPVYSPIHILKFLDQQTNDLTQSKPELIFISFSAGVVGAIGAATAWQTLGGKVLAFFALDGWGVPLYGNFPIHRLSHDYFTHWSSALLGTGIESFYADPPVEHLELWRKPETVQGWWTVKIDGNQEQRSPTSASIFLKQLLQRYEQQV